ncbi:MAG: pyridoxamine 5'-phosphate oxidase family protein, partial [Chloroflexota bacterium]|nr:pyridoxamine 5'-phosphate oxidase family protein [Chloroflexota bacterium]
MKVHDYHKGNLQLQDKFGTRKLAERLADRATDSLEASQREMIANANMFFLATCDERGLPTVSYKGGAPGFVRVVDGQT